MVLLVVMVTDVALLDRASSLHACPHRVHTRQTHRKVKGCGVEVQDIRVNHQEVKGCIDAQNNR